MGARRAPGHIARSLRRVPPRRAAAVLLLLALGGATVAGLLQFRIDTGTDSFLPASDLTMRSLESVARGFGGDPIVVTLQSRSPQALLTDQEQLPRLLQLEGKLSQSPGVQSVYGPGTVLNQVAISAGNVLSRIAGARDGVQAAAEQEARQKGQSPAQAAAAGQAAVRSFDERYGKLLVQGMPAGLPTLHNPNFVKAVVFDRNGDPQQAWTPLVPNSSTVAILVRPAAGITSAQTSQLVASVRADVAHSGLATQRVTVSGVPAVISGLAEEVQHELPIIGGIAVAAIGVLLVASQRSRPRWRRVLPLVVALAGTAMTLAAFGWLDHPVSLGVVAFLPILLGIGSDFPLYLFRSTARRRVIVAAAASAAGFLAMVVSPLPFVRELGIALAVGIALTVGITMAVLRLSGRPAEAVAAPARVRSTRGALGSAPRWARLVVLGVLVAMAGFGWSQLPSVGVAADPETLAAGVPSMTDAQYTQSVVGYSGDISVTVKGNNLLTPEAFQWEKKAEDEILAKFGGQVSAIVTPPGLLSFLGDTPDGRQIVAALQIVPSYISSAVVSPDGRMATMLFGIKLQDLGQQRDLIRQITQSLPPAPPGVSAELTGLPVAAARGYTLISDGRLLANVGGILAAGAVLLLGLRNRRDAVRALLAAAMSSGWMLATMWLLGWSFTPLDVALGSLIAATGCEYTVLLADSYRRGRPQVRRSVAIACACACAGYLALTASGLSVLREFGATLAASVLLSMLAAIVVIWSWRPEPGTRGESVVEPEKVPVKVEVHA
ncbi:MMPL family transporter [Amycolatopsis sp. K13G38]|uniref:MMPL family transporter n=1 Tax=Amycolatopsis acididurans TaxID=2724524 RepID=A0ABX1J0C1_9PSEU|nr:MMPL family transporter [Amycolatopsis acididurans]NKQ53220.1 MMPL family transporter [Amycolatopsis acididurans]